jgi:lysophospholipase L1-like esterase
VPLNTFSLKIIILGLGTLSLISIFFNILLYSRAKQYYLEVNQVRLDPLGLSTYPVESNPPQPENSGQTRVLFFGDSRAEAWPDPSESNYEFINRGIGGQTTVQIRQRFDQHLRPLQPDIVVLQLGINDLKTIGIFPEQKDDIITNCRENIAELVKQSQDLGAVVILTTIFPFGEVPLARKPFWSDDIFPAVQEVNAYMQTLADDERVIVFDPWPILADKQGMMLPEYRIDELHYNQQAYEKLNQEFTEVLKRLKL